MDEKGHSGVNGQHQPIFKPYSVLKNEAKSTARCQVYGYDLDESKICNGYTKTSVYSNSEEIRQNIGDKVKTGDMVEEITLSISEGDNAMYSNSISFGESITSSQNDDTNHCVDKGTAESLEEGTTKETSKTSEKGRSYEENEQESKNQETSVSITDSKGSQTDKSSTWEEGTTTNTEVNSQVTAEAGFSGFGFSGSVSASVGASHSTGTSSSRGGSTSNSQSEEHSKTNSMTEGTQNSYGFSRSQTSSDSKSDSQGSSQSKSKSSTINTNICSGSSSTSSDEQSTTENNENRNEKSLQKSYEIPGDMRSIQHTNAMVEAETYFAETSGSISHTEATCQTYSVKLSKTNPPAFSNTFKEAVKKMAIETEKLWQQGILTTKIEGTIESFLKISTQEIFDDLFSEFIYNFGTHFIESAKMGAVMRLEKHLENLKSNLARDRELEECLEEQINKGAGTTSSQKEKNKCKDDSTKRTVEEILENSNENMDTFGSGSNDDIHEWSRSDFPQPTMLPDFKLQPIVKIFSESFMSIDRYVEEIDRNSRVKSKTNQL